MTLGQVNIKGEQGQSFERKLRWRTDKQSVFNYRMNLSHYNDISPLN